MKILDENNPKEVAEWKLDRLRKARYEYDTGVTANVAWIWLLTIVFFIVVSVSMIPAGDTKTIQPNPYSTKERCDVWYETCEDYDENYVRPSPMKKRGFIDNNGVPSLFEKKSQPKRLLTQVRCLRFEGDVPELMKQKENCD